MRLSTLFAAAVLPLMEMVIIAVLALADYAIMPYYIAPCLGLWLGTWVYLAKQHADIILFSFKKIEISTAWYDLWMGSFIDRHKRRLYICPIPCLLITIQF